MLRMFVIDQLCGGVYSHLCGNKSSGENGKV